MQLNQKKNLKQKAIIYLELAKTHSTFDSIDKYANKSLKISKKNNYEETTLKTLFLLTSIYRTSHYFKEAFALAEKTKLLALKLKDTSILAYNYQEIGLIHERKGDYENSIKYLSKSLHYLQLTKDSTQLPDILSNIGYNYSMIYKDSLSLKSYKEGLVIANKTNNQKSKCFLLNNLGSLHFYMGDYKKAILYLEQSITLSNKLGLDHILNSSYGFLGDTYKEKSEYDKSILYLIKAIKLAKKRNDLYSLQLYCMLLAENYASLNDNKNSLLYLFKALNTIEDFTNSKRSGMIYNRISEVYLSQNKLDSAYYYNKKSFLISDKHNDLGEKFDSYRVLGDINFKEKKYKIAIVNYNKCLTFFDANSELQSKLEIVTNIGNCYNMLNNNLKAITYYKKALDLKVKEPNIEQNIIIYKNLSNNYKTIGKYKKALFYFNKSQILKDSVYESKILEHSLSLKEKYETQQKETEILKLTNENIKKEAKLAKSKYIIYIMLSLFLLGLALTYFFWHKRKQKQKMIILESKVKASEQEKKRIGKELHDGIASSIIKLVYETEGTQLDLSDKLLKTYNEVRNLSHQLDNTAMHDELFLERVLELVPEGFKDKMFTINIEPNHLKLEEPYGTHFYRVIQELIANNLKHAKASQTSFRISKNNDVIKFTYKDNGIGISDFKKGNGFKNMEDRIELMKGELNLNLENKNGIELTFSIPYKTSIS